MVQFRHVQWAGIPPVSQQIYHRGDIEKMITDLKIKPVSQMELPGSRVMINPQPLPPKQAGSSPTPYLNEAVDWWFKYGGIRIPHFHFGGDVYLLNEDQWRTFSSGLLKDFAKKLTGAKNISFSQLVDVADAVEEIG
jgi:hypothetical protein